MSTHVILDEFRNRTGWNDHSCLMIVGQYIEAQQSDEAYLNHLREVADEENAMTEDGTPEDLTSEEDLVAHQGWSDKTLLDLMLVYIDNQQTPDAFRDHLSEAEESENQMASGL